MTKILFFPSFSAGSSAKTLKENGDLFKNITSRFYTKNFNNEYYHPYFLLTAGHLYKDMKSRETFGLTKDILTMGDSGGHQIATGNLKWNIDLRKKLFNWMENNSDISMIIDIPPVYKGKQKNKDIYDFSSFDTCKKVSVENAKYIFNNQSGNVKYLNVLQGNTYKELDSWYNDINKFSFYGWSFGGISTIYSLLLKTVFLLDKKEFEKNNIYWLHFLGVSKITDFVIITFIQKLLDEKYGKGKIQCSIDSSTPQRGAAFGSWIFTYSFIRPGFTSMHLSNQIKYPEESKLPCNCFICKNITMKDINKWDTMAYNYIIYHNLFKLIDIINFSQILVDGSEEILKEALDSKLMNILLKIRKIFNSKEPMNEFFKYTKLFKTIIEYTNITKNKTMSFDNFFNE